MSIINKGKATRSSARRTANDRIDAIRDERDHVIQESLDFEGEALRDLFEYAAGAFPDKGLTSSQLATLSGGDFSVNEIAGNLRYTNCSSGWSGAKSRYHQLRANECPVTVEKRAEWVARKFVEVDENNKVIPGSSMTLHSRKNRYYIRNKD